MWVLIDNYDSFTHILHHYLLRAANDVPCIVVRNDAISLRELVALHPERIIISPGPETPLQAGISMQVIEHFHAHTPILGVCLGHQALGMYYGGTLSHAPAPVHGKVHPVRHSGLGCFQDLSNPMPVMRYHSLTVSGLDESRIEVLASTEDGIVMAFHHRIFPSLGVQFHPESVGTPDGFRLIENWANTKYG